jgi:DHA1 family inner membrane transport protein
MKRTLAVVSLIAFATTLFSRAVEPMVLLISRDLAVSATAVALLSTAFSVPFALIQPILGPTADMVGKTRVMLVCLGALVATAIIGAIAPNYWTLLVARILAGVAAGGIYPVAVALVGDLVPVGDRQVALGRYLAVVMSGNILGTVLVGAIGDLAGWRSVFVVIGCCGAAAFVTAMIGLREVADQVPGRFDIRALPATYREIFANPRAKICYTAVFFEGIAALGILPYPAVLLAARGEVRASIAGFILAGFALGSIVYALFVRALLGAFSPRWIMLAGGCLAAVAIVGVAPILPWPFMFFMFVLFGFGFYMLHGSIQVQTTELAPAHRAASTALHSFSFSLGQGLGPVLYGLGFAQVGMSPTLCGAAILLGLTGLVSSQALRDQVPQSTRRSGALDSKQAEWAAASSGRADKSGGE